MKEVNFDGLASPTHNYSGLAIGNLAATRSAGEISRPRDAALQGLEKMRTLANYGIAQAFVPPQLRPSIAALRRLGFGGSDEVVLKKCYRDAPGLFAACSSASSMWTANAATIAPSSDAKDGKTHITPANLVSNFHRSIEVSGTFEMMRLVFSSTKLFTIHEPLPATTSFADEGAANHTRLSRADGTGIHLFVYGTASGNWNSSPKKFPARQTLEASQAIARLHQLPIERSLFLRQNPDAIDAGVFHNDVISVGHENVFIYHERAFAEPEAIEKVESALGEGRYMISVSEKEVSLSEAVSTYLFNSQIVNRENGDMLMICPIECRDEKPVARFIEKKIIGGSNPIGEVIFQNLRQSMKNGGGPACLRLRIPLNEEELAVVPPRMFFTEDSESFLREWIAQYYPEELVLADLVDIDRLNRNREALKELWKWIGI